MGDGTLSQDEIDALLQGTDELMTESLGNASTSFGVSTPGAGAVESLSEMDKNVLGELIREIGNSQANALSALTGINTSFGSPFIDVGALENLKKDIKGRVIQAKVSITGGIAGEWVYVVPEKSVLTITNILIGQENNTEITDLVTNTFGEVITQITGAMITVLSEKLNKPITPGFPNIDLLEDPAAISVAGGQMVVRFNYVFNIHDRGSAKIFVFLSVPMARSIINAYNAAKATAATQFGSGTQTQVGGIPVRPVGFEPLQLGVASEGTGNIALLLDVSMKVSVELGRTRMTIKEILGLGEGSIIELDKLAGEPVDILVNDKLIAQGEVVVIDENFAVRVTKIVSPMERLLENTSSRHS
ncbi:Flagellar motor switch protein FliN [Brevinematales bacterium NS]|nr:flagellar motor switch protein FliN [Brevinematales bacterium]QJR21378.1 Flagellar motor switch protein FliN [Brevinematales bacterium NS]